MWDCHTDRELCSRSRDGNPGRVSNTSTSYPQELRADSVRAARSREDGVNLANAIFEHIEVFCNRPRRRSLLQCAISHDYDLARTPRALTATGS